MSIYVEETTFFKMSENIKVLGSPNRSNIGVVTGTKNSLLVDSGQNEEHLNILSSFHDLKNLNYTVLTHFHQDHTLGLAYLKSEGIGHHNIFKNLLDFKSQDYTDEGIKKQIEEGKISKGMLDWYRREYPDRSKLQVRLPTITYEQRMGIDLGNCEVELTQCECDHTNDTSIVYVPQEEALFLGDCLSPSSKQTFDTKIFKSMLAYLLSFDSKIMVEGHGPPLGEGKGNDYLQDLVTIVDFVEQYQQDVTNKTDEIMKEMVMFDRDSVTVYLPFFVNGLEFNK